jgi:hypothetical protein
MNIDARIYDTDTSGDWVELPAPRDEETLTDYAYRLQKWARRQILAASDSYGDCDSVEDVDSPNDAHVVVRAENEYEVVEYYLACTVKQWEPSAKDRASFSRQLAEEGDAFARAQWEREL